MIRRKRQNVRKSNYLMSKKAIPTVVIDGVVRCIEIISSSQWTSPSDLHRFHMREHYSNSGWTLNSINWRLREREWSRWMIDFTENRIGRTI